jgi:hypothetical protein
MYRVYGQIFAPAKSALPPSMAVVSRGAMERCGDAQDLSYIEVLWMAGDGRFL